MNSSQKTERVPAEGFRRLKARTSNSTPIQDSKARVGGSSHFSCCVGLLLGGMILFLCFGCQKQKPLPDTLSLEIDTRNGQPLRQALYGFNTNMMNGDYGYLDDDFVALTKGLRQRPYDFPAGRLETSIIGNLAAFLRMKWHQPSIRDLIDGIEEITSDFKGDETVKSFSTILCSYATP